MASLVPSAWRRTSSTATRCLYRSYSQSPPGREFSPSENAILTAALAHVPRHGFSSTSLALGAKDAGYLDASTNLFPQGPFSLIRYHLVHERLALADKSVAGKQPGGHASSIRARVKALTWERLTANAKFIDKWQEALAIMALPSNVPGSLHELAALSDEIWFLAGDTSVDATWYTKRASLSAIYASADLFMTSDTSPGFSQTQEFLERRFADTSSTAALVSNTSQFMGFTARAALNVLRSKGIRI